VLVLGTEFVVIDNGSVQNVATHFNIPRDVFYASCADIPSAGRDAAGISI